MEREEDHHCDTRGILWCNSCHNTIGRHAAELLGYTREGWPKCCGEVMILYIRPELPNVEQIHSYTINKHSRLSPS